ncbi:putative transmembrane protein [Toxoplasma gondii TgCatPRC2]|uniref:Transmembrane protein n=14 Tax=Toxoplasma gondii TaxID=5811 RepID=A0A125YSL3_TOXGG|nr:hypothetical protein TGME49_236550 [Toxoplasma gondii ME49]EPR60266.1 hypothetical protein TGGT1_236550 [Toxoplasma gondii GT1]ESS30994.1 putative transmembrane protein [Toxoplasma gondii VEG]KAF4640201.1 hypothetical protein TGRH88_041260 [Toxoplasma gondii]KFG31712.1 putative transmembrane protein [Toxoplasma gondii GAB2-2007-GAL-DOM2]KFG44044.1 putative transmembrane protein [Toxoplasma gondii FOU]KFG62407.1 putative transmembrane protein [Toxoplasma gondii RUB]KFH07505.1 putative tran|eukprot:XP_002369018.1 hypothetical protein TGME49_236550 [Toxoplasma gondii ME49]
MSPFPPRVVPRLLPCNGMKSLPFSQAGQGFVPGSAPAFRTFVTSVGPRSSISELIPGASKRFFAGQIAERNGTALSNAFRSAGERSNADFLKLSQKRLGGSLEDYYTNSQLATCIQSPWPFYIWSFWAFSMVVVPIGLLFQSNYYFSGRILPKVNGNTQLCEDSW